MRLKSAAVGLAGDLPNTDSSQPAIEPKNEPVLLWKSIFKFIAYEQRRLRLSSAECPMNNELSPISELPVLDWPVIPDHCDLSIAIRRITGVFREFHCLNCNTH